MASVTFVKKNPRFRHFTYSFWEKDQSRKIWWENVWQIISFHYIDEMLMHLDESCFLAHSNS